MVIILATIHCAQHFQRYSLSFLFIYRISLFQLICSCDLYLFYQQLLGHCQPTQRTVLLSSFQAFGAQFKQKLPIISSPCIFIFTIPLNTCNSIYSIIKHHMQLTMAKTDIHVISADMHTVLYSQIYYKNKCV